MLIICFKLIIKQMKNLLILFIIFFLCSCEKSWYHEYVIINDTDYNVTISAYDTDVNPTFNSDVITINPGSSYSVLKGNGLNADYHGVFTIGEIDSVVIIFNNERSIIQTCNFEYGDACKFDRNIMDYNNESDFVKTKKGKSQGKQEYRFTYTITEEDYNNAVPIED